jgi:hypothetical protein
LVVAKVRERLAVSKRAAWKIDEEIFNLTTLNEDMLKPASRYNQKQVCSSVKLEGQRGRP